MADAACADGKRIEGWLVPIAKAIRVTNGVGGESAT